MTAPKRFQRTRKRGGGMPAGAVYVGRPSKWGNPYTGEGPINHDLMKQYFQEWIDRPENADFRKEVRYELAGKDLACWCPLDKACHAEVLLEVANSEKSNLSDEVKAEMPYLSKIATDQDDLHLTCKH